MVGEFTLKLGRSDELRFVFLERPDRSCAAALDAGGRSYVAKLSHTKLRRQRMLHYQQQKSQRQIQHVQHVQEEETHRLANVSPHNILSSARRDPFSASTFALEVRSLDCRLFDHCKEITTPFREISWHTDALGF